METEGVFPYDNSIANHEIGYIEKNNFTLLVVMTPRRSDMIVFLALHLHTNFKVVWFGCCDEIMIFRIWGLRFLYLS